MADDSTLPPPLTTTTIANIAGKLEPHDCRDVADELFHWLLLGIALPALVNVAIIILYAWTYVTIRSFRLISDQIVSSTHWLSRTAVRVGLGPTAKTALVDFARKRPELATLVGQQS